MECLPFFPAKKLKKEIKAIGIDLGTTNSTVAEASWEPGKPPQCRVIELDQPTREGVFTSPLVPSVVAILPDSQVWVGEGAKRLRAFQQEANLTFEKNLFYETKNEMGLRKTYYRAPDTFNHASKIAGHVLAFLKEVAQDKTGAEYEAMSVSLPASFQLNQRRDTLLASQYAGFKLADDDLIDEPTAALIDYIFTEGRDGVIEPGREALCVVFDFGGGTCDVSIVQITGDKATKTIKMSQLSVSRYHRLGGGDIDSAIVHECLIPEMLKENGLKPLDLTWVQKKRVLEPQLLSKAEALKIALSKEVDRLMKFGRYQDDAKQSVVAKQPPAQCQIGEKLLSLSSPALSAEKFENILEPFLDRDQLFLRETEFRMTQSIFAPLQDALTRADKEPQEIDFCLMVGGSCLIPQVRQAIEAFFTNSKVKYFPDSLGAQTAVARGAAWNALFKALVGRPLIEPVLHDGIALVTATGDLQDLVPAHVSLPYPPKGKSATAKFKVPKGRLAVDELRLEVVGTADRQVIFNEVWQLPESATPGEKITLEYQVTAGKQFVCRAFLTDKPDEVFEQTIENPLVTVINPHTIRLRIEEAEEKLRKQGGGGAQDRATFVQIAKWYAELNQKERALEFLRTALMKLQRPDTEILNLQGIYYDELGDHERAEKAYLAANDATRTWDGPLFNLALSYRRRKKFDKALEIIEKAIKKAGEDGPNMTLKAICVEALQRKGHDKLYTKAVELYGAPSDVNDWELGWFDTAARKAGDEGALKKVERERKKRRLKQQDQSGDDVLRPEGQGDIVPRGQG